MSGEIVIYGASDDLIEVEGGGLSEEFNVYLDSDTERRLLAFADGTVLGISYDRRGVWRIVPVVRGPAFQRIDQAPEDDDSNYSDRAYLKPPVAWVVFGTEIARAKGGTDAP